MVAKSIIQCLVARYLLVHHAPSVVVATEPDCRPVVPSVVVERRSDLIDGNPMPCELDVGNVTRLADSCDTQQFAARDLDRHRTILGKYRRNQRPYCIYSERREHYIPAGRRVDSGGTPLLPADDPSAVL